MQRGDAVISLTKGSSHHPELCQWLALVAKDKDRAAFSRLFQFFAPRIKRFGLRQCGNEAQANDLVQDTMTNVWKKAHLYDEAKGAATTWVYTVMRNASFDYLRKKKTRDEQNIGDDIWPIENALSEDDPSRSLFHDHLLSQRLEAVIDSLPQTQKIVIKGIYFQDLSQEQLSNQLGVPIGTIKSRLRLALAKIRSHMREQDHD